MKKRKEGIKVLAIRVLTTFALAIGEHKATRATSMYHAWEDCPMERVSELLL